jgi:hypothetical protein
MARSRAYTQALRRKEWQITIGNMILARQAQGRGFEVDSVLPLTPLGNSAAFTWGEFLLGKLRQFFAVHVATAVRPSAGLAAAG